MAWTLATAVDVAVSTDWAMDGAMEAIDLAAVAHGAMEDMASLASTKKLLKVDTVGKSPNMFGLICLFHSQNIQPIFPRIS